MATGPVVFSVGDTQSNNDYPSEPMWIDQEGEENETTPTFRSANQGRIKVPTFMAEEGEDPDSDLIQFHRFNSKDIIYSEPDKQPKIVGPRENYLKGEVLGNGAYSKVKEMLDCVLLCRRAVKIMKKKRIERIQNGKANVQREIRILKKLKHCNIIELVEVFEDEEKQKMYMVLEYCIGSLQQMLDSAPGNQFPVWQAHKYFVQLIDGLEYLHSRGIVHKDIKPGNLLLTTEEVIKITDFGSAEEIDLYSQSANCISWQGSPAFYPPEVVSGQGAFQGFKGDIWSSGVTLYHFTTGKFPFEGGGQSIHTFKLFSVIAVGRFSMPPDLQPMLQDLIKGMLFKDAEMRLSIPDIKRHPWVIVKHPKPLPEEIVAFPPYPNSVDPYRGTTVLPYLECYYNYDNNGQVGGDNQEEMTPFANNSIGSFPSSSQSLPSVNQEVPISNNDQQLSVNKSSLSSQNAVLFPISKSVDELETSMPTVKKSCKKSDQCSQQ